LGEDAVLESSSGFAERAAVCSGWEERLPIWLPVAALAGRLSQWRWEYPPPK